MSGQCRAQKTIAILYICTGEYVTFWKGFFESAEKNFAPGCHKEYFVFTDAGEIFAEDDPRVHRIEREQLPWPGNTLYRYRYFLSIEEDLKGFDFICFMNSNALFLEAIPVEDFFPEDGGIVAVQHPYYVNVPPILCPFERRKKSLACIPYLSSGARAYVCGGINGGSAGAFLEMSRTLAERIAKDEDNGIVAVWHDESHFNRYVADLKSCRLLSPAYAYPEQLEKDVQPFEKKILLLYKPSHISYEVNKGAAFKQPGLAFKARCIVLIQRLSGLARRIGR